MQFLAFCSQYGDYAGDDDFLEWFRECEDFQAVPEFYIDNKKQKLKLLHIVI